MTVTCDQCGQPLDPGNTGTVCRSCVLSLLNVPMPARPLLLGKATPMPATPAKKVIVEYTMPVRVTVDLNSGDTVEVQAAVDQTYRGEPVAFYNETGEKLVPAVQPPKFTTLDEADAWLEANPIQTGITEAPEVLERAHALAQAVVLSDWF